ncbi:MAG: putative DNA binding domain-containing protein [Bacteroidetes bacterium]|nr:putative DNA binding domain-containing protein [Bacteroidota bacterium]
MVRSNKYLQSLLTELISLSSECEWVEFKHNNPDAEDIGEYISALSNSAALIGKANAYLIWGVDDTSHAVLGTKFDPAKTKVGNEELENWLLRLLSPKIDFRLHSFLFNAKPVVLLEIGAAFHHPVAFKNIEYVRIGSYKKKLKDYPEREGELWRIFASHPFELEIALADVDRDDVLHLIDYPSFFELTSQAIPTETKRVLEVLESEAMISRSVGDRWNILNLGAMLFARHLTDFPTVGRKALRVIQYPEEDRVRTTREQVGGKGYAAGFDGLIEFITGLLPTNEVIGPALRREVPMFPPLAIRELIANAIIHQDFRATGTSPLIEIFAHRMEITNPGRSLVGADRLLDSPPKSRNEMLASFLRRIGICEERGSGIDKVVFETEFYQLPAPIFETPDESTRVVLFAHREFRQMDRDDRARACYLHSCLRYVQRDFMTNFTLRNRFGVEAKNSAMVSRIIKDTIENGLIRPHDASVGSRAKKYVPWWA